MGVSQLPILPPEIDDISDSKQAVSIPRCHMVTHHLSPAESYGSMMSSQVTSMSDVKLGRSIAGFQA